MMQAIRYGYIQVVSIPFCRRNALHRVRAAYSTRSARCSRRGGFHARDGKVRTNAPIASGIVRQANPQTSATSRPTTIETKPTRPRSPVRSKRKICVLKFPPTTRARSAQINLANLRFAVYRRLWAKQNFGRTRRAKQSGAPTRGNPRAITSLPWSHRHPLCRRS